MLTVECILTVFLSVQDVTLDRLLENLGSESLELREVASQALLEIGEPALAKLRTLASSLDGERATRAKSLIGMIEQRSEWTRQLKEAPAEEQERIIVKIREEAERGAEGTPPSGKSRRPDLIPILRGSLEHPIKEVRAQAAWALAYMNHEKSLPVLLEAVQKPKDRDVRYPACLGLTWLGRDESRRLAIVPALEKVFESLDPKNLDARFDIAETLLVLGKPSGPEIYEDLLKTRPGRAAIAAKAMAHYARKETIALIIKRMASAPTEDAKVMGESLERLTGQHFGDDVARWYRWFEKNRASFPEQIE